jgi:hypothetical protein
LFYFRTCNKLHRPYSPSFVLSIHHPPLYPPCNRSCFTFLSFIFWVFIVQRGFAMVFLPRIYCTLIRWTPSITLPPSPSPFKQSYYKFDIYVYVYIYECVCVCAYPDTYI